MCCVASAARLIPEDQNPGISHSERCSEDAEEAGNWINRSWICIKHMIYFLPKETGFMSVQQGAGGERDDKENWWWELNCALRA